MNIDEAPGETPTRFRLRGEGHRTVRVDRPDDLEPDAEPRETLGEVSGRLIDLLLKAIRSAPADRRGECRHRTVAQEIWVGWWKGEKFDAFSGRLIDLSRGGARVVLATRPPRKTSVWVCKDIGSTLVTVRAEVVGQTPAPGGASTVRLRFPAPCPTSLCEAVLCRNASSASPRVVGVDPFAASPPPGRSR